MQHTVDAKSDLQALRLRLDMDIGSTYLRRIIEHRLQQYYDRRFFDACRHTRGTEFDNAVAELLFQLARKIRDFFGTSVNAVDGLQQFAFVNYSQRNISFQYARQLIVSIQIGRIGHADPQRAVALLQNDRAVAAGLTFRQHASQFLIDVEKLEIDIGNIQMLIKCAGNLLFGDEAVFHKHSSKLSPGAFLLAQCKLQLLFRQQFLLN